MIWLPSNIYRSRRHFNWACVRPRNDAITEGAWAGIIICWNKSMKRFLKRNLADVGMAQWMRWLTNHTNKKCHAHSDMHSIPWAHYSTTGQVIQGVLLDQTGGDEVLTHFETWTLFFCGGTWLLNNVPMPMVWSAYHCVHGTSCLCALPSASAFIEPSLHQLDFF